MTATPNSPDDLDVGHDLQILSVNRRGAGSGAWVLGRVAGHRFEALVFPEHAENPDWEIGDSRISKLWLQRLPDGQVVFSWDRGLDLPPADAVAQRIVGFLEAGLAEHVFGV